MISHFLAGSTLLRIQSSRLPQIFCRYRSLTAAIERGRRDDPNRPIRPRAQAALKQHGDGVTQTRHAKRLERFGPSKSSEGETFRGSRPRAHRDRDDRLAPPRSRTNRNFDWSPSSEGKHGSGRSEEEPTSGYRSEPRKPREDRYGRGDERPPRREGGFEARERKPFDRERKSFDRERKSFDRERKSFDRERKPFDRERKGSHTKIEKENRMGVERGGPMGTEKGSRLGTEDGSHLTETTGSMIPVLNSLIAAQRENILSEVDMRLAQSGRLENTGRYSLRDKPRAQPDTGGRFIGKAISKTFVRDVESLPYTTAASEFIYGFSSVLAAMKANRRKLYQIYVHSRGANRDGLLSRIRALKLFPITNEVGDEYMRAMDKASSGRPHNGVILESSPLPVLPITELKNASVEDASFSVGVDSQSAEDAVVNGNQELYSYKAAGWRYPLILYVDGVLDEGNLGAIARSAYFLGADAIITPTRQSAPWSHIAVKASAGAAEAIPIFKVSVPTAFLGKSARAGWRIYASDSIPPPSATDTDVQDESSSNIIYTIPRSTKRLPADHCPVAENPTILMMGAEGEGLRGSLLHLAHYKVGIPRGREVDEVGVDSLNVSVAASLLCYEMLQKPKAKPVPNAEEVLF
ncbi:hypothetical protein BDU57DRAFT_559891 [Ampelomyces quisqualis]|uniref:rRNA methyltransferase 1, mitochondrial n=1 Tax=Ampelomyces quisqualis TaxID=50730 RepID=A0A6A5QAS6_AMPQU|nr:hypothetical protein BDU57DRAFT_559891 [Ampelomyces quisqualis]